MLLHGDLEHYAYLVLSHPAFHQIAPIVILIFVPTLVLWAASYRHSFLFAIQMVFDSLASLLPWNWSDASSSLSNSERKRLKRRHVRNSTRDDQVARTSSQDTTYESSSEDGYYPGLVNISGTYCFMNSTLQALASLTYLQPQLDEIHARAESLDVPTPVIDNLRELVRVLNTPSSSSRAHRPIDIIAALSTSNPSKNNSLFSSREHQDAQELFQLLSECIKNEAMAVAQEMRRDRGLSIALTKQDDLAARNISKTVFDGLTANRRSCMQCGYTEAVMHFPFDNWQLALPGMVAACRLEECLEDYTRLELLSDCICRKCSMLATYRRLEQEADRLTEASQASNNPSSSKKKRARDTRKLMARVKAAIDEGRIEEDIPGVKTEKVFSQASTKQSMVARPPPVLALHLNRSIHYGHHATKNNARVIFPEILDLTPFTTSGQLSTQPSAPISSPPPPIPTQRSVTPTPSTYAVPRTLYRLAAVVCHYGQHSFGHYVCFRRKPRPPSAGDRRFAPPKLACPLGCDCARCERYGPVRDSRDASGTHPGRGWLRISDDAVQECGLERVLQEGSGAFMLYYERVQQPRASPYTGSPRGSEETVKVKAEAEEARTRSASRAPTPAPSPAANGRPEQVRRESSSRPNGNGDVARRRESRERRDDDRGKVIDPRVVRRTSAHRRPSAPPMMRTESSSTTATTTSKHSHHPSAPNGEPAIAPSSTTPVPNGRPHHHRSVSHSRPHTPPNGGAAPPISPQRPPLSPTPSSKSGRLRKSRRSISQTQGDAHPVASGQAAPPTSLRA